MASSERTAYRYVSATAADWVGTTSVRVVVASGKSVGVAAGRRVVLEDLIRGGPGDG
ncbi:hypothetical protein [Streptomyces sp. SGAir0957]